MSDARTEARRRIAQALLDASGTDPDSCMEQLYQHEADRLADAVLALFPDVGWATTWTNGNLTMPADPGRATHRQLVLGGPVKPIPNEEPNS